MDMIWLPTSPFDRRTTRSRLRDQGLSLWPEMGYSYSRRCKLPLPPRKRTANLNSPGSEMPAQIESPPASISAGLFFGSFPVSGPR